MSDTTDSLPFHRAHKKVAFIDADGKRVEPDDNNAIKFEKFIFDPLPKTQSFAKSIRQTVFVRSKMRRRQHQKLLIMSNKPSATCIQGGSMRPESMWLTE